MSLGAKRPGMYPARTRRPENTARAPNSTRGAKAEGPFKQGCWFTMLVEIKGDKVVAQTSNGLKVSGSHSDFATKKPNYRFVMKGQHLLIDDLRIWEVVD